MIEISKKSECCGCGACMQICPQKCIKLCADEEGFYYPKISQLKCIDCNLCKNVCPIINKTPDVNNVLEAYVAYIKDKNIREKSSSGGIFTMIAQKVLNDGGIVFGAAFDTDWSVKHIGITNATDLKKLCGSKYLQSRTENCYSTVKLMLESGTTVFYTGTACQVSGLKKYLGKHYANLITADILCHGVPSPKVWEKYLSYQEKIYNAKVSAVSFRKKNYGWKSFSTEILFENQRKYEKIHTEDLYMKLFLKNICLRPSCYKCVFKDLSRESDISIGDCWGIEKYMPDMDDNMGTSVILVHSELGQKLMQECQEKMIFRKADVDLVLPPSADSRRSVPVHKNRRRFFTYLQEGKDLQSLVKLVNDSYLDKIITIVKNNIKMIFMKFGIMQ